MPESTEKPSVQFKSEIASKVFDSLIDFFIEDYMMRRYVADKSGWRTLSEIASKSSISPSLLYGKHSTIGPALDEPVRRGLIESRVFPGERGRGGEVMRLRVTYEKDAVREIVSNRIRLGKDSNVSGEVSTDSFEHGITEFLSESSLLSTLPKEQIRRIVQNSEKVSYAANEFIVQEGDLSSGFFLILEGQVEVWEKGRSIRKMGRGQFFGETALGENESRTADITAVESTVCLKLRAAQLKELINIDSQIAVRLLQEMVKRNRGVPKSSLVAKESEEEEKKHERMKGSAFSNFFAKV
jgi:hypothetical protein